MIDFTLAPMGKEEKMKKFQKVTPRGNSMYTVQFTIKTIPEVVHFLERVELCFEFFVDKKDLKIKVSRYQENIDENKPLLDIVSVNDYIIAHPREDSFDICNEDDFNENYMFLE